MIDVFIIGKGPAGISASLYTVRAGLSTTVTGKDMGSLGKTEKIENYYGFSTPVSGKELFENGIAGAERLGVKVINEEVFDITYDDNFTITTDENIYNARSVILAAGASRKTPLIKGIAEYEGKGVSYCAVCDAFFYRNMNVAVIGNGKYALSEAAHLLPTSASVYILTDGKDILNDIDIKSFCRDNGIEYDNKIKNSYPFKVNTVDNLTEDSYAITKGGAEFLILTEKISEITGDNGIVDSVMFENGGRLKIDGVFIAEGIASGADLGRKLGITDQDGKLAINPDMSTFVPGFFAAGDCTGGMLQISKAVYEGALAGTSAVKFIRGYDRL